MNCMNCKSVVDVGMEICPNCGFNLRVQRKCFSLSNMYYNLGLDKARDPGSFRSDRYAAAESEV